MVEKVGDYWVNYEERVLMPVLDALLAEEITVKGCGQQMVSGGYVCTRPPGHPKRHIARAIRGIAAAWPGDLPPTVGDLS
jgi:hypothetical protein